MSSRMYPILATASESIDPDTASSYFDPEICEACYAAKVSGAPIRQPRLANNAMCRGVVFTMGIQSLDVDDAWLRARSVNLGSLRRQMTSKPSTYVR